MISVMERSRASLTKDEIEEFWRHKQQEVEAHMEEANAQNVKALLSSLPISFIFSCVALSLATSLLKPLIEGSAMIPS